MMRRSVVAAAAAATIVAAFVGPAASAEPLPVIHEEVTVNPNNPVAPGGILDACVTPRTLGMSQICVRV
jgi:hypothetical protein